MHSYLVSWVGMLMKNTANLNFMELAQMLRKAFFEVCIFPFTVEF